MRAIKNKIMNSFLTLNVNVVVVVVVVLLAGYRFKLTD